ncbi:hypothetical protein GGR57DRAFT_104979 [Xylariaceae sp. FL1272]|nr:hypothetical protein GGR57DRAFT_104979 [Xylariaceae sp. FL1272]
MKRSPFLIAVSTASLILNTGNVRNIPGHMFPLIIRILCEICLPTPTRIGRASKHLFMSATCVEVWWSSPYRRCRNRAGLGRRRPSLFGPNSKIIYALYLLKLTFTMHQRFIITVASSSCSCTTIRCMYRSLSTTGITVLFSSVRQVPQIARLA